MDNRISHWRAARGLSQAQLANRLTETFRRARPEQKDVHVTTISRLETGGLPLRDKWLIGLAEVLEVQPSELLGETPEPRIGFSDGATPYDPPKDSNLAHFNPGENRSLYLSLNDDLDRVGIKSGSVMIINQNAADVRKLQTGDVKTALVLCRYHHDKKEFANVSTLPRQFIWPSTLIRNSHTGRADPLDTEHDDVHIVALIETTMQQH